MTDLDSGGRLSQPHQHGGEVGAHVGKGGMAGRLGRALVRDEIETALGVVPRFWRG
jgi:hypothetical protein